MVPEMERHRDPKLHKPMHTNVTKVKILYAGGYYDYKACNPKKRLKTPHRSHGNNLLHACMQLIEH